MQFFRSLAELFPRFARRSGALERAVRPSLPSRRLRLAPLENRELLAVDAFAVPFGPPPLENVANEAAPVVVSASVLADDGATLSVRTETAEPVAPETISSVAGYADRAPRRRPRTRAAAPVFRFTSRRLSMQSTPPLNLPPFRRVASRRRYPLSRSLSSARRSPSARSPAAFTLN